MDTQNFTVVGENIHCSRIVKRQGKRAVKLADGSEAVSYHYQGESRQMPIPPQWGEFSPAFQQGNVKHTALAIFLAINGKGTMQNQGKDYLEWMAASQIESGAHFLDVNVDEYSTDRNASIEAMVFLAEFLSSRYDTPLSIDSSDPDILRAGLSRCRPEIGPPLINSLSLERKDATGLLTEFDCEAIVNAAGDAGMPCGVEDRMDNLRRIISQIAELGVPFSRLHVDALVMPVSTDPMNAGYFMQTTATAVKEFPGIHACGGISNISFGMPRRKLLNMVLTRICADQHGLDGGIIDPMQMPVDEIAALDPESEPFRLAGAVLTGEDTFGMEFITASRDGRI